MIYRAYFILLFCQKKLDWFRSNFQFVKCEKCIIWDYLGIIIRLWLQANRRNCSNFRSEAGNKARGGWQTIAIWVPHFGGSATTSHLVSRRQRSQKRRPFPGMFTFTSKNVYLLFVFFFKFKYPIIFIERYNIVLIESKNKQIVKLIMNWKNYSSIKKNSFQ